MTYNPMLPDSQPRPRRFHIQTAIDPTMLDQNLIEMIVDSRNLSVSINFLGTDMKKLPLEQANVEQKWRYPQSSITM